jgi:hypothetical protein
MKAAAYGSRLGGRDDEQLLLMPPIDFNFQTLRAHDFAFSRRDAPELCFDFHPRKQEGAGKTGCALHPRSRVQLLLGRNAHEHTGSAEAIRPSLRNGFTAYSVLFPVTGLRDTVIPEKFCFPRT